MNVRPDSLSRNSAAALFALLLWVAGCEAPPDQTGHAVQQAGPAVPADAPPPAQPDDIKLADTIKPGDRVLFIGDDITQQMYYTRAVASALMAIMPDDRLQFFNGGMEGATAQSAHAWVDELIVLTRPTVVAVCLGFNDGKGKAPTDELVKAFTKNLGDVLDRVRGYDHVRLVVVISPPPVQAAVANETDLYGENQRLNVLAKASRDVAIQKHAHFIGLFGYMLRVYVEANRVGGASLTLGGTLPGEPAQTMIASAILYGLGVTAEQLEPIGWSPLLPRDMGRVREALAIHVRPPSLEQAQASRTLYEQLRRCDELFFQYWRLADRPGATRSRVDIKPQMDAMRAQIQALASRMYSPKSRAVEPGPAAK